MCYFLWLCGRRYDDGEDDGIVDGDQKSLRLFLLAVLVGCVARHQCM